VYDENIIIGCELKILLFKSTFKQTANLVFAWYNSNLYNYSFCFLLVLKVLLLLGMIDFFIYYVLSKQTFEKLQRKQFQNKDPDWGQFDPTGTKCTFFAGRQRIN